MELVKTVCVSAAKLLLRSVFLSALHTTNSRNENLWLLRENHLLIRLVADVSD